MNMFKRFGLLAAALALFIPFFAPSVTDAAASYSLLFSDDFNRTNTVVGTTTSSTNVGNGWTDYFGTLYRINSGRVIGGNAATAAHSIYYSSSTATSTFRNGKVVYTGSGTNGNGAFAVARFNPASGGSGYVAGIFSRGAVNVYRTVNGANTQVTAAAVTRSSPDVGTLPANMTLELIVTDINASATQLLVRVYDSSDLNTVLATASWIDTSPLPAGYAGFNHFQGGGADQVEIWSLDAESPLEAGPIITPFSATTTTSYKTQVFMFSNAPIGGTYPFSYQWQRSLASTTGFADISGATSVSLADSGLAPGTTYFYRLNVSDSSTSTKTVTSNVIQARTLSNAGHAIGFIGDSITAGTGSGSNGNGVSASSSPAGARVELHKLIAAGYDIGIVNRGIPSTRTYHWTSTTTAFTNALNAFKAVGVDTVQVMLGTNEAVDYALGTPVSTSTYRANMQNIVNGFLAPGTGITQVMLNYSPYYNGSASSTVVNGANVYLQGYQLELQAIASSTPGVYLGDTTFWDTTKNNLSLMSDGLHPNTAGHAIMGNAWAQAYVANFEKPLPSTSGVTTTGATVSWTGNVPTTATIYYGTSTSFGSTTSQSLSTSHSASLSGLAPNTAYYYRVVTTDGGGFVATSSDMTFTTSAEAAAPTTSASPSHAPGSVTAVSSAPMSSAEIARIFGLPAPAGNASPDLGCVGGNAFSTMTGKACSAAGAPSNPGTPALPSGAFSANLSLGMTGPDVIRLQKYLNAKGFAVAASGAGSPGKETSYFGPATRASLARFQKANGISPAAGYFGPATRALVNK